MTGFFDELLVLVVGDRVTIDVIFRKELLSNRHFSGKYRCLLLIEGENAKQFLLGDSHGEFTGRHTHHFGPVDRRDDGIRQRPFGQQCSYVPALTQIFPFFHRP